MHASDCALHNGPALPAGPCDCGARSDAQMRAQALEAAVRTSATVPSHQVLKKARQFYAFLKGEPVEAE